MIYESSRICAGAKRNNKMTVKMTISASEQKEIDEILTALRPVITRHNYRVKRQPPIISKNGLHMAYISTREKLAEYKKK